MKSFVITVLNNEYSESCADRCIASASDVGLDVEKFYGVDEYDVDDQMNQYHLSWTWAGPLNNTRQKCPKSGLQQFPYTTTNFNAKKACSMSHFFLWKKCVDMDESILILEHDAVFLRPLPTNLGFKGICQVNDPAGATRRGGWWSQQMKRRGKKGVFEKTWVTAPNERDIPDGLAGNSAYMIKPWAAQEAINKFYELGVWPNDATLCKQLFPYLEEYYPFITKVIQTKSTTT